MRGFYVPDQTEEEEAEIHENAPVENLADDDEIKRKENNNLVSEPLPLSY